MKLAAAAAPARLRSFDHASAGGSVRVHVRSAGDGGAELFVNADRIYRLNPTAAAMAVLALEGAPPDEAARRLSRTFNAGRRRLVGDYTAFRDDLNELLAPDPVCPVHDLDLEVLAPFSEVPSAPYRMDLALTYRCNDNCAHCYNARPRSFAELPTTSWCTVLDRLWEIGVPHICFTGGEATLRDDLPELIAYSVRLGHIVGLLSNGRRLSDAEYVQSLATAGLDHAQITLESCREEVHDKMVGARARGADGSRIRNASTPAFVMTNTTLLTENAGHIEETIDFLGGMGVPTVGVNSLIQTGAGANVGTGLAEGDLAPVLQAVRERTDGHGQRLIWYTPTQYCHFDPVAAELGVKGCSAARYNMCVEPNGAVLPCQSFYQPVGNILTDAWDAIWHHELTVRLRERTYMAEGCHDCALVAECGGGCPLSPPTGSARVPSWIPGKAFQPVAGG
jgi:radical SAM protein with 4Fe4S-binding SPASM domain